MSLSVSRPLELVQALRHDNMFWRTTRQRLLVERGRPTFCRSSRDRE